MDCGANNQSTHAEEGDERSEGECEDCQSNEHNLSLDNSMEAQLAELQKSLVDVNLERDELKTSLDKANKQLIVLQEANEDLLNANDRTELDNVKSENAKLRSDFDQIQCHLKEVFAALDQADNENKDLQVKLEAEFNEQINSLHAELSEKKEQLEQLESMSRQRGDEAEGPSEAEAELLYHCVQYLSSYPRYHEEHIVELLRDLHTSDQSNIQARCNDILKHIREIYSLGHTGLQMLKKRFLAMGFTDEFISQCAEHSKCQAEPYYLEWASEEEIGKESMVISKKTAKGKKGKTKGQKQRQKKQPRSLVHPAKVIERWDLLDESKGQIFIVAETTLLHQMQLLIEKCFDYRDDANLFRYIAKHIICIFGPMTKYNKLLASQERASAKKRELVPDFCVDTAVGTLLCQCEANDIQDMDESNGDSDILKLKSAIYRNDKGDDMANIATVQDIEKVVTKDRFDDFIRVGHPTMKVVTHLFGFVVMRDVIEIIAVYEVFAGLGRKDKETNEFETTRELIEQAIAFAARVRPNEYTALFHERTSVYAYVTLFVFPALEMNDEELGAEAMEVTCAIFSNITTTNGKEERLPILDPYKTSLSKSLAGHYAETAKDFCSDDDAQSRKKRNGIRNDFFCHWFKGPITEQLPANFFSKYGYTQTFLRVSATNIMNNANLFVKQEFFNSFHNEGSSIAEDIKGSFINKEYESSDDETGARSLIIETQDQIESLKKLLKILDHLNLD